MSLLRECLLLWVFKSVESVHSERVCYGRFQVAKISLAIHPHAAVCSVLRCALYCSALCSVLRCVSCSVLWCALYCGALCTVLQSVL